MGSASTLCKRLTDMDAGVMARNAKVLPERSYRGIGALLHNPLRATSLALLVIVLSMLSHYARADVHNNMVRVQGVIGRQRVGKSGRHRSSSHSLRQRTRAQPASQVARMGPVVSAFPSCLEPDVVIGFLES